MPAITSTLTRTLTTQPEKPAAPGDRPGKAPLSPFAAWVAASLALGVACIHVIDQGGLPGSKDPSYIGLGYYALEVVAVLVAVALIVRRSRRHVVTWLLAGSVAAGPLAGYVLSRGPGLPGYTDDRGNWTEPIGLVSLTVEGLLLLLTIACARVLRSPGAAPSRI